jgi:hypothetical protein
VLEKLRPRSAYDVMAAIAFALAVAGGTAWAADTITGTDVVDGSLTYRDLATETIGSGRVLNDSLASADVKDSTLSYRDIAPGTIGGGRIQDNSIKGADVDESTFGRPIYASVAFDGTLEYEGNAGITSAMVYKPTGTTGIYCFRNLPFRPTSGMAVAHNSYINAGLVVAESGWPNDCADGDVAKVELRSIGTGDYDNNYFTVWFTDNADVPAVPNSR